MNEEEIRKLPVNDEYSQCMRKLRKKTLNFIEQRKKEILNCNHLFLLLDNSEEICERNSSDCYIEENIVECVHSGLTNIFKKLEFVLSNDLPNEFEVNYVLGIPYDKMTIETEMFNKIFSKSYTRGDKSFNNNDLNLISKEKLYICNPKLLYDLALIINPDANNEEIFEIMKKLNSLESYSEKIRLNTVEQSSNLLERYYKYKEKVKKL